MKGGCEVEKRGASLTRPKWGEADLSPQNRSVEHREKQGSTGLPPDSVQQGVMIQVGVGGTLRAGKSTGVGVRMAGKWPLLCRSLLCGLQKAAVLSGPVFSTEE